MKLMTHVVIGYPTLQATYDRVQRMVAAGVDLIELQIPFSDPLADGPIITAANHQALRQGVTVTDCIQLINRVTKEFSTPFIVVGYYNTLLHTDLRLFQSATAITFPDIPLSEEPYEHYLAQAKAVGLKVIQLISPATTPERLQQIAKVAEYYVYCVARYGVTGTGDNDEQIKAYIANVRSVMNLPIAIGFGIQTTAQVQALQGVADIVVVGSALLQYDGDDLSNRLKILCASR
jgi:tryptophan synthase alpha chain